MDHQEAKQLFSDYLEGELSDEQAAELTAHLEECEACSAELDELRDTLSSLAGLQPVEAPEGFAAKVQRRIRRRSRGRFFAEQKLLTRIPWEWISFLIILIMLVMYYMMVQQLKQIRPHAAPDGGTEAIEIPADPRPAHDDADASDR